MESEAVDQDTEYAIEGRGENCGPNSNADRYTYPPPEYEMKYDERDRYEECERRTDDQCLQQQWQQQQQLDPHRQAPETRLFRSEDIMARPYRGYSVGHTSNLCNQSQTRNQARFEPRLLSRDSRFETNDREWRDRRTPNMNMFKLSTSRTLLCGIR